ncbi:lipocalin family protein [uncultured Chitinophaga sp.]|jgi:hypothetical protein|uniref:lipocalin family protein n=1 Tax=uncultured Chitinophaga sp. TaxID=339340 RepID=UPI002614C6B7|nr:lipocalin family protein [uncultured Chitinophaga sp.]
MNRNLLLAAMVLTSLACNQQTQSVKTATDTLADVDSSLLKQADSTGIAPFPDTSFIKADTISYEPQVLTGKWMRPVAGRDKETQGFDLRKDGSAQSINMYTLVYEKWALSKDTLLLWHHTEGVEQKDSAATVDTTIIKDLTDTTLVIFPVNAAEGYLEKYEKKIEPAGRVKGKKQK